MMDRASIAQADAESEKLWVSRLITMITLDESSIGDFVVFRALKLCRKLTNIA